MKTFRFLMFGLVVLSCSSEKDFSSTLDEKGLPLVSKCTPHKSKSRDYFQASLNKEGGFYVVPRPDHSRYTQEFCASDPNEHSEELVAAFQRATLCPFDAPKDVSIINNLAKEDVILITGWLHEKLYFSAVGNKVDPWPHNEDVVEVCKMYEVPQLNEVCDRANQKVQPAIYIEYTKTEAETLSKGLNDLYNTGC